MNTEWDAPSQSGTLKPVTGDSVGSTETHVTAGDSTAEGFSQVTSSGSSAQPITGGARRKTAAEITERLSGILGATDRTPSTGGRGSAQSSDVNARVRALPESSENLYSGASTQETNPVSAEGGEPVLAAASQEQSDFNGLDNSGHEGSSFAEPSIAQQPESSRSSSAKKKFCKAWAKFKGKSNGGMTEILLCGATGNHLPWRASQKPSSS